MRALLVTLLALSLSACTTTRYSGSPDEPDPYEGFNRGMWAVNDAVDTVAIKPAATVYRTVAPVPARRGISRFFANLAEPFSAINNLLQGKPKRAANSLGRFLINSTIGVGGLADHATELGIPEAKEDFGQTLAVAGARRSPYLVLPLLGPSTVRDAVGTAVRFVADPAQIASGEVLSTTESRVLTGTRVIDARSQLIEAGVDDALKSSADPYATARSAYFQRRRAEIADLEGGSITDERQQDELLRRALQDSEVSGGTAEPPAGTQPQNTPAPAPTRGTEPPAQPEPTRGDPESLD